MLITVAAWVGISVPVSIAIGTFIRTHGWAARDEGARRPATPRTFEKLYARAFPGAERPMEAVGPDSFAQSAQVCMN
jgi:hypothetical protein